MRTQLFGACTLIVLLAGCSDGTPKSNVASASPPASPLCQELEQAAGGMEAPLQNILSGAAQEGDKAAVTGTAQHLESAATKTTDAPLRQTLLSTAQQLRQVATSPHPTDAQLKNLGTSLTALATRTEKACP